MNDDLDAFDEDLEYRPRRGLPIFLLPLLTAAVAAGVGLVLGAVAMWALGPSPDPVTEMIEVPRELTEDEISAVCAPFIEDATTRVEAADQKVKTLEAQVVAKERRVAELEAEMTRRGKRGVQLVRDLERARAELTTLQGRLEVAIEEKEQVIAELKRTRVELEEQKVQTEVAREDALDFKWRDFVGSAQLDVCEKGNRRRMGRCREKIEAVMTGDLQARFRHCVRSGQAIPSVHELPKGEELPQFAAFLDEDDRITRGWYVLLCDPTLPEAEGAAAPDRVDRSEGGLFGDFGDVPDHIEDLDD